VVATDREIVEEVEPGIRARYRRSEAPPPYTYAITVEAEERGSWYTVRLWDNADDVHEHHMHRYTKQEGKLEPMILEFESINQAMAAANDESRRRAAEIVRQWRQS